MYNPFRALITTEVNYGTFMGLRDSRTFVAMRSEHTGKVRTFHWHDEAINKLYYYNKPMDVYLCVKTKNPW